MKFVYKKSRSAFTMIELIFVIVIIGILAAVTIPKLAATRDDAKLTKEITNAKMCIDDAGAAYTARGSITVVEIPACVAATTASETVSTTVNADNVVVSNTNLNTLDTTHVFAGTAVSYN